MIKKIDWDQIKQDVSKVHPKREIVIYTLSSINGTSLAWVNVSYSNYQYRKFCRFCVEIEIELGEKDKKTLDLDEYKMQLELGGIGNKKLDFDSIENYFADKLFGNCTALVLYINTTEKGFEIEIYVDNLEKATDRLNEMKFDTNRIFNFDFKITEDENWDIIGMMLY